MIQAGGWRRSRARSARVTITAHAPSLSMQQSKSRSGSAIIREAWWSSSVIGLRIIARGFIERVPAQRHRDVAELLARGAVLDHVTARELTERAPA